MDCPSSHCCLQEEFSMVSRSEMQPNDSVGGSCWGISGSGLRRASEPENGWSEWGVEKTACFFETEKKKLNHLNSNSEAMKTTVTQQEKCLFEEVSLNWRLLNSAFNQSI